MSHPSIIIEYIRVLKKILYSEQSGSDQIGLFYLNSNSTRPDPVQVLIWKTQIKLDSKKINHI